MKQKAQISLLLSLVVAMVLSLAVGAQMLWASDPAQDELAAVWQRVRESGVYHFDADVTQTEKPMASILNAGRSSRKTSFHIAGSTDIATKRLQMRLWSGGGSVQLPDSSMEIKVEGDTALARQGISDGHRHTSRMGSGSWRPQT